MSWMGLMIWLLIRGGLKVTVRLEPKEDVMDLDRRQKLCMIV